MLWIWREPPRLCARIGRDHDNKRTLCRREWEKQVRSSTLSFRQGKRKTHHPRFGLHLCVLANPSAGFGPCFFVCFLTMARGSLRNNGLRGPKHPTIEACKGGHLGGDRRRRDCIQSKTFQSGGARMSPLPAAFLGRRFPPAPPTAQYKGIAYHLLEACRSG